MSQYIGVDGLDFGAIPVFNQKSTLLLKYLSLISCRTLSTMQSTTRLIPQLW